MKINGYASLLQQFREAERTRNRDYTDQAMQTFMMRKASILAEDAPQERKERLIAVAERQWSAYMQRPMPDDWTPPDPDGIPF